MVKICKAICFGLCAASVIVAAPSGQVTAGVRALLAQYTITVREFPTLSHSYVGTCLASGPNRALWALQGIDQDSGNPAVAEIGTHGKLLQTFGFAENSYPSAVDITAGPDNAVWFTDEDTDSIDRLSASGKFTQFPLAGFPVAIALGQDAALWFTVYANSEQIARITTAGKFDFYSQGLTPNPGLSDIAAGPDRAMWFTEYSANQIGRIGLRSHAINEYHMGISPNAGLNSIAAGPDGNVWFTEYRGRRIGRITPQGAVTEYAVPLAAAPNDIAAGPDGAMWFTQDHPAGVARIDSSGRITEYAGVTQGTTPGCIVQGPDANMWFLEFGANRMARVTLHA